MAKTVQRGASLKPSEAASGFSLDDVDVVLESLRFTDVPPGTYQAGSLFLEVGFSGKEIEEGASQHYSAGSLDRFKPSDDGLKAVPSDEEDYDEEGAPTICLVKSTNAILFLKSLVDNGFDEEKIEDTVDVFEGTDVHLRQVPQPKRSGLDAEGDKAKTILLVTKINSMPGEKKGKGKGKGKGKATSKKATEPADEDLTDKAVNTVIAAVKASENGIAKKDLLTEAFRSLAKDPDRNAVIAEIKKDEFLEAGPWTYEDGTIS